MIDFGVKTYYAVAYRCSGKPVGEPTTSIGEAAKRLERGRVWGMGPTDVAAAADCQERRRVINSRMRP